MGVNSYEDWYEYMYAVAFDRPEYQEDPDEDREWEDDWERLYKLDCVGGRDATAGWWAKLSFPDTAPKPIKGR